MIIRSSEGPGKKVFFYRVKYAQGLAMDELRPTAIDNAGKRSSAAGRTVEDLKAAAKQGEAQAHELAPVSGDILRPRTRLVRC
jgi:hypothetical protein